MKCFVLCFYMIFSVLLGAQVTNDNLVLTSLKENNICYNKVDETPNKFFGIDFTFLGTSLHFANKISSGLYLGVEGGVLPDKLDWVLLAGRYITQNNTIWSSDKSWVSVNNINQIIFGHVIFRWKPKTGWLELDSGLRWAIFTRSGYDIDDFGFTRFFGGYCKPMFGNNRIKIGARLDFGSMKGNSYGDFSEFVILGTPLIRVNFK